MKCWTINEEVRRGIKITRDDDGEPSFIVGSPGSCSVIPVSKDIKELFEQRAEAIARVREALEAYAKSGGSEDKQLRQTVIEVTGQDVMNFGEVAHAWAAEDPEVMWLNSADVSTNEPFRIILERRRESIALVHVETTSSGQQYFEANAYDEYMPEGGRPLVLRAFHEFPSVGIGVVARGSGPSGEPQGLFLMYPRASFRINRDVSPEVLVVSWPGSSMKCFTPAKFKKREKDERRAA